jgi:glyoxylase-like metal-dependent hydrolase (beta-lactamase superfamily II)
MTYSLISVGAFEVNCAVVRGAQDEAWVIDPGEDAAAIIATLRRDKLRLVRIILTHGHIDHISALDGLLAAYPDTPVTLHPDDAAWAFGAMNRFPPYHDVPQRPASLAGAADGDMLADGTLRAEVLHTPGHSPGCICLLFAEDGVLFTGDTLFAGSVGRTDLPGGNGAKLARSLKRLAALPGTLTVIAGHGPATTIAAECRANPFLARCNRA